MNVAIVGAGTAGLASAAYLSRAGFKVTVYERADRIKAIGSGILLQPSGLSVLYELGILDECLKAGAPIKGVFGTSPLGKKVILDTRYDHWMDGAHGLGIHRSVILNSLYNLAIYYGVDIQLDSNVYDYIQDDEHVDIFIAGQHKSYSFDCLILANGRNSTLQFKLPIKQKKSPYSWGALWATVGCPADYDEPFLRQWYKGSSNMFGILPIGFISDTEKKLCSLFLSMRHDEYSSLDSEILLTKFKERARQLSGDIADPFLEQLKCPDQISFASYTDIDMPAWNHGRVLAIGDCAHSMSPQLGQGANMALVDAKTLISVINDGHEWDRAFAIYSELRKDHLDFYQSASRALTPLFQSSGTIGGVMRDLVMITAQKVDYAKMHAATTLVGGRKGWLSNEEAVDLYYWDGSKPGY